MITPPPPSAIQFTTIILMFKYHFDALSNSKDLVTIILRYSIIRCPLYWMEEKGSFGLHVIHTDTYCFTYNKEDCCKVYV